MIQHAGYQTIGLQTFVDFVRDRPVELPPRPLLLTFDDGAGRLVDRRRTASCASSTSTPSCSSTSGASTACDPEYLTWHELRTMEDSGPLEMQLHSGPNGHTTSTTARAPTDRPLLRVRAAGRGLRALADRVQSDIEAGPEDARRSDSGLPAARLRPPVRQPTARKAPTTRGSPPISSPGSRTATTPCSPRTTTHWRTRAPPSRSAASRSRAPPAAASSTPSCRPDSKRDAQVKCGGSARRSASRARTRSAGRDDAEEVRAVRWLASLASAPSNPTALFGL